MRKKFSYVIFTLLSICFLLLLYSIVNMNKSMSTKLVYYENEDSAYSGSCLAIEIPKEFAGEIRKSPVKVGEVSSTWSCVKAFQS